MVNCFNNRLLIEIITKKRCCKNYQTNNASDNSQTQKSHLPQSPQTRQLHVCVEERRLCGQAHRLRLLALLLQVQMVGRTSACVCGRRWNGPLHGVRDSKAGLQLHLQCLLRGDILCINSDLPIFLQLGQWRSFQSSLEGNHYFHGRVRNEISDVAKDLISKVLMS